MLIEVKLVIRCFNVTINSSFVFKLPFDRFLLLAKAYGSLRDHSKLSSFYIFQKCLQRSKDL